MLSPQYGFELLRLYIGVEGKLFHVVDPVLVHGRVEPRQGDRQPVRAREEDRGLCRIVHADLAATERLRDDLGQSRARQRSRKQRWKSSRHSSARLSPSSIESISLHPNQLRFRRVGWRWTTRPSNRQFYIPAHGIQRRHPRRHRRHPGELTRQGEQPVRIAEGSQRPRAIALRWKLFQHTSRLGRVANFPRAGAGGRRGLGDARDAGFGRATGLWRTVFDRLAARFENSLLTQCLLFR